MVGLDTNVLIRYLVKDEPTQAKRATSLMRSLSTTKRGFVSLVVIVESIWVLDSLYGQAREKIVEAILGLTRSSKLVVQCATEIEAALSQKDYRGDPADAIIAQVGVAFGCETTLTFDKKATRLEAMTLLT
jgi:predicted nucleic-acid-binding protein